MEINIDGYDLNTQIKGFYFKSEKHITRNFLIQIIVKSQNHNALAVIHEILTDSDDVEIPENLSIGDEIITHQINPFCEIDIWNKYYFPKFTAEQYQFYHNQKYNGGSWVFDKDGNMDELLSLAEVMKYALELGIKVGNIELY